MNSALPHPIIQQSLNQHRVVPIATTPAEMVYVGKTYSKTAGGGPYKDRSLTPEGPHSMRMVRQNWDLV
jgi:hypothetical protein